ncbi:MAG: hypothetical protein HRT71_08380 [Flavobacteriales bacterium]|nr:hypothetical protein [Flavobacteriales bacterium]
MKDNDQLSFNLTNCQNIEFIECHNSGIKEFDVSDCTALRQFFSIGNSLTDLNLTANRNLELIHVFNDSTIKSIDIRNGNNINIIGYQNVYFNNLETIECIAVDDSIWFNSQEIFFLDEGLEDIVRNISCSN